MAHFHLRASLIALSLMLSACQSPQQEAQSHATQALALLEQNRIGEARLEIARAISAVEDDPRYYLIQAQIEYRANSPKAAFNAYQDALALDSTNLEALLGTSQLGLEIGRIDEATSATEQILTLYPNQKNALMVAGLIAFVKKRYDEAVSYADKVLSQNSTDEGGTILWIRSKVMQGHSDEARGALAKFEKEVGPTVGTARTRLEMARFARNAEEMDRAFRELTKMAPETPETLLDHANFRFKLGQPERALELTKAVLESDKPSQVDVEDALELWKEYDVRIPDKLILQSLQQEAAAKTKVAIADYLISSGDLTSAKRMLSGIELDDATALKAKILFFQDKFGDAKRLADQVLSADDTNCLALAVRAQASLKLGAIAESRRFGQRATTECPNMISGWIVTAQTYAEQGATINARRVYRDGIAANLQNTGIAKSYVNWLLGQNSNREALAAARRLTNAAPALVSGWKLYANTCRELEDDCLTDAEDGLTQAKVIFGKDLAPGERPPNGLFGRFVMRGQSQ